MFMRRVGKRGDVGGAVVAAVNCCVISSVGGLGVVNGGEMGRDGSLRLGLVASRPTI